MVNRIYLHLVLHGIFRHMIRQKGKRGTALSSVLRHCCAESIIDGLTVPLCDEGQVVFREERCTGC
ncbi:MAG: hypothetical protein ACLR08_07490 [Dorea longicatena]